MPGNKQAYQKFMDQGNSAAWEKNWDQAARYYHLALEEMPDQPAALSSLGLAYYEMKDFDKALEYYRQAVKAAPDDPAPYDKIGRILEQNGRIAEAVKSWLAAADLYLKNRDLERAIEHWNRATALDPENLTAYTKLAMIYEKIGNKAEAVRAFLACASLMQRSGDTTKALQVTEYARQMAPQSAEVLNALNRIKSNQLLPKPTGRPATGALKPVERKKELSAPAEEAGQPPVVEARQKALSELASMLFDAPDESPANSGQVSRRGITTLSRGTGGLSLENAERTRILAHLGQAIEAQTNEHPAQAIEELERAIELGLNRSAAFFDLGYLYANRNPQKAIKYLKQAVKHPDYALGSYLLIGELQEDAENLSEAAQAYIQALSLADAQSVPEKHSETLRQLYEPVLEAQARENDPVTLKKICETIAAQLHRADWRKHLKHARAQLSPGDDQGTPIPLIEMLLESRSGQVVEALAQVQMLTQAGKYRSAMEEAYYALQYAPTFMPLHIMMGDLLVKENHLQEAVEKYLLVSNLYTLRGESSQAIALLSRVVDLVPMDLAIRGKLIELLLAQGKVEETIRQYISLAEIYYQLAELDMARQTYTNALKLAQESTRHRALAAEILMHIADIDMQRLDIRQALRTYEQLRTLQPDDPEPRSMLVDLNFRMGLDAAALLELDTYVAMLNNAGKRDQAVKFIENLIELRPDRWELKKRLADGLAHTGKVKEAVETLDTLADLLLSRGDQEGALAMVEAIIALNPPNVGDYQKVLVQIRSGKV